ncbi:BTAD domain-containing putative transcriptional regulator [Salinispora sp. H7-4]|uniref:ATP-binding protein n=1 Tax=Salinispora sp. H7-4 TaxID=2748321 RepID=UPI0015D25D4F|nr:BTAD domain-containing putative transcriptional regulator [Salinispora sp. H7-4]NYT96243.1 winged helix-turn-helix domain-containing protein [Salinispora sp. H7-4]
MAGPAVRIRLLGGVEVVDGNGAAVDIGAGKCRALLAALALQPGTAVPDWRLIDLLWGEQPPRTAVRTLQSYIARLRGGLGATRIVRSGAAYRLDVPADAVDVIRFGRRVEAGDLAGALAEWTGDPLAGVPVPGLAAAVDGLVERWLGAVEADLAARVDADAAATVGPLTELSARYPFREGIWALLMTALYRVGRQADALAAYRTARQRLIEHLGVEPGPRLRRLELAILGQDHRIGGARRPEPVDRLPRRAVRLLGRDAALDRIGRALVESPVVTLVGPGGIGKTALAVAAAQRARLEHGAWLVDLTEITTDEDVPQAVAAAVRVEEGPGRSLSESIVLYLSSLRALLVLDNCEHVVDGAARLAQAVADGCPQVRVLATAREPLGLHHGHERLVAVPPLPAAGAAADLFTERANALTAAGTTDAAREVIEEICRCLDGLPLAIELAAAQTVSHTPQEIRERLDDQLGLLVGGRRTGADRHRTMRATIEWSYRLLTMAEQDLLQRLSVCTGPVDRAGAAAVAAGSGLNVNDVLHRLVQRSMVSAEPGPFGQRFRLLEPVRQFAAEHLAAGPTAAPAQAAHTRYVRERVASLHDQLTGLTEVQGVAQLDELWPNLRVAVDRAFASGDHRLAHDLFRPIATEAARRHRHEIGQWAQRLLEQAPPEDRTPAEDRVPVEDRPRVVAGLIAAASRHHVRQDPAGFDTLIRQHCDPDDPVARHLRANVHDDYAAQIHTAPPALAELRRLGADDLAAQVEVDLGVALVFQGQYARGEAQLTPLVDRFRSHGPPTLLHWTLMLLGFSASFQGQRAAADQLFDQAIDVPLPARTHSPNQSVRAQALFRRGDRRAAYQLLRAHVEELLEADNMHAACVVMISFVTMMPAVARFADGARILAFLDTTGALDNAAWAAMVADAREKLAAVAPVPTRSTIVSQRQALAMIGETLDDLLVEQTSPASC